MTTPAAPQRTPHSRALRTRAEIEAAGAALAKTWGPASQEVVDRCYAILAPYLDAIHAARSDRKP